MTKAELEKLVWGKSMLELASHLRVMRGNPPSLGTWRLGLVALGVVQIQSWPEPREPVGKW